MKVTRDDVVRLLIEKGWTSPFATTDIAQALRAEEYAVRAAISWLCVAGVLKPSGVTKRLDRLGKLYDAATYQWTGQTEIPRAPRNRAAREDTKEAAFDLECFNILLGMGRRKCGAKGA